MARPVVWPTGQIASTTLQLLSWAERAILITFVLNRNHMQSATSWRRPRHKGWHSSSIYIECQVPAACTFIL